MIKKTQFCIKNVRLYLVRVQALSIPFLLFSLFFFIFLPCQGKSNTKSSHINIWHVYVEHRYVLMTLVRQAYPYPCFIDHCPTNEQDTSSFKDWE